MQLRRRLCGTYVWRMQLGRIGPHGHHPRLHRTRTCKEVHGVRPSTTEGLRGEDPAPHPVA